MTDPVPEPRVAHGFFCDQIRLDAHARVTVRVDGPPGRKLLTSSEARPGTPPRRTDSTKVFVQLTIDRVNVPVSQEGDLEIALAIDGSMLRAGRLGLKLVAPDVVPSVVPSAAGG